MFRNYLITAIRNIRRQSVSSFINISGFAIGIASCLLIMLFVLDEINYDKFHENADQIYRIIEERKLTETPRNIAQSYAPLSELIQKHFPEIKTVRFYKNNVSVRSEITSAVENKFFYADSSVFDIFDFKLDKGESSTALSKPYSIVISKQIVAKYFDNENPIGKILKLNNKHEFTITGILSDIPSNSHLSFDFLASFSTISNEMSLSKAWWSPPLYTYILIPKEYDAKDFVNRFPEFIDKYSDNIFDEKRIFSLQPLLDIHLHSKLENEVEPNSDIRYVYVFSAIALFVLIIACLNFMNLSTAKIAPRAREVAMRKVVGAQRHQLIIQFMTESILLTVFSFFIAIAMLELLIPVFNIIIDKQLSIDYISYPHILVGFVCVVLFTGILSGSYPALYLSSYRPIEALKNKVNSSKYHFSIRKILVIVQFSITIFLISITILISRQLNFIMKENLGFNQKQILVMPISNTNIVYNYATLKNQLLKHNNISNISISAGVPGKSSNSEFPYKINTTPLKGTLPNILVFMTDYDFFDTYSLEFIEGKKFSANNHHDKEKSFIINETTRKAFGWEKGLGQELTLVHFTDSGTVAKQGKISGVVKDFHYRSLHDSIEPILMELTPSDFYNQYMSVKIKANGEHSEINIPTTIDYIKAQWSVYAPEREFEYFFIKDNLKALYETEKDVRNLINAFSLFSVLIACLGLFGLSVFLAEQRAKEICIRKVLGASIIRIMLILVKDFTKSILFANIIAWPCAYFFMKNWLKTFAYHTEIKLWIFVFAGSIVLIISLLTVLYQSIKVITRSPSITLKYE